MHVNAGKHAVLFILRKGQDLAAKKNVVIYTMESKYVFFRFEIIMNIQFKGSFSYYFLSKKGASNYIY